MSLARFRLAGLIAALLVLSVAPSAAAADGPVEVPLPKGELPAVAYGGGHVLWAVEPRGTGPVRIYSATPGGGAPKLLAAIKPEVGDLGLKVSLAASPAGWIVGISDVEGVNGGPYELEVVAGEVVAVGGFDGSLHTVLRCRPRKSSDQEFPPVATAAGEQLFAFAGAACGPSSLATVTPQGAVQALPHAPRYSWNNEEHEVESVRLTMAGDTLAYTASDSKERPMIGIHDLASGGYRQLDPLWGGITGLAARADGTVFATGVVFASQNAQEPEPGTVFAVDPGQSTVRPLTGLRNDAPDTLLAGGERLLLDSRDYPDLALASTSGQALGAVGAPGVSGTHDLLAFSGEQAAYTSSTCAGAAEVTVLTLPASGPAGSSADGCPISVTSSKITVGAKGQASVRLSCPLGCTGELALEVSAHTVSRHELARLVGHEGSSDLATGGFKLTAPTGLVRLRLDRFARRFLARHHGHLTAELSNDDDPEATASITRPVKVALRLR